MSEIVSISIERLRDDDGAPTCFWEEKACLFMKTLRYGTLDYCFWNPQDILERRTSGAHTIVPGRKCPVWSTEIAENHAEPPTKMHERMR